MLIFQNGTAYFEEPSAVEDIDYEGEPIAAFDLPLSAPCYIEMGSEDRSGRNEDGVFPRSSFTISLDYDSVSEEFNPSRVRVVHERKGDLGTFPVQRIEFYNLTRTIQIWV